VPICCWKFILDVFIQLLDCNLKQNCFCYGGATATDTELQDPQCIQPLLSLQLSGGSNKLLLRSNSSWSLSVVVSYMFAHTLCILGPLCTKQTLKWSTIFPMQITCMHLHVMISSKCLVTHRAWKRPNILLQCLPPPCNNTGIIMVSSKHQLSATMPHMS
jgi:hypothetical protein